MPNKLIAREPLTYATRRMKAGEEFDAVTATDADVLVLLRLAKKKQANENQSSAAGVDPRAEYETLAGRPPDGRWGDRRLAYEIRKLKS